MKKINLLLIGLIITFLVSVEVFAKSKPKVDVSLSSVVRLVFDGNFSEASKVANSLEKRLKSFTEAEQNFVNGYIAFKLGDGKKAVSYFEKTNLPELNDYVIYFWGLSLLDSGRPQGAVLRFEDIRKNHPESVWFQKSLWSLVISKFEEGKFGEALEMLAKVKTDEKDGPTHSEYNFLKAKIFQARGDSSEAITVFKEIYFNATTADSMNTALTGLRKINSPQARDACAELEAPTSKIRLANRLMSNYSYDEAVKLLEEAHGQGGEYLEESLADAYFKAREYEKSKKLYKDLVRTKGGKSSVHYWVKLAQSAARCNDFDLAIDTYKQIIKKFGGKKGSINYEYKLAFLYMDAGRFEEAIKYFSKLNGAKYSGHLKKNILWNLAWCYFRSGNFDEAIKYFEQIARSGFGTEWRLRAGYWIGRAQEEKGNREAAKLFYARLIDEDEFGYYGFLANKRLYNTVKMPKTWKVSGDFLPVNVDLSLLPAWLNKSRLLEKLGLSEFASMELKRGHGRRVGSDEEALALIEFANMSEDYRLAHLVAISHFKYLLDYFPTNGGLREFIWRNYFPKAYPDLVLAYAEQYKVDPNLIVAIMREESRFQTDVISSAGAIGLMQIIPPTAERLARELEFKSFQLRDMYRPEVNIKFGIKYLGDLHKMFEGEKVYMIASYNAGEKAVERWKRASTVRDIEEFIEEIPYKETNNYVKKVLRGYWIYNSLYSPTS